MCDVQSSKRLREQLVDLIIPFDTDSQPPSPPPEYLLADTKRSKYDNVDEYTCTSLLQASDHNSDESVEIIFNILTYEWEKVTPEAIYTAMINCSLNESRLSDRATIFLLHVVTHDFDTMRLSTFLESYFGDLTWGFQTPGVVDAIMTITMSNMVCGDEMCDIIRRKRIEDVRSISGSNAGCEIIKFYARGGYFNQLLPESKSRMLMYMATNTRIAVGHMLNHVEDIPLVAVRDAFLSAAKFNASAIWGFREYHAQFKFEKPDNYTEYYTVLDSSLDDAIVTAATNFTIDGLDAIKNFLGIGIDESTCNRAVFAAAASPETFNNLHFFFNRIVRKMPRGIETLSLDSVNAIVMACSPDIHVEKPGKYLGMLRDIACYSQKNDTKVALEAIRRACLNNNSCLVRGIMCLNAVPTKDDLQRVFNEEDMTNGARRALSNAISKSI